MEGKRKGRQGAEVGSWKRGPRTRAGLGPHMEVDQSQAGSGLTDKV